MADFYRENFGLQDQNKENAFAVTHKTDKNVLMTNIDRQNMQDSVQQALNNQSGLLLNSTLQIDENNLGEYICMLQEHQKNCERQAKYVEAEMARKRVLELKAEYDKRQKQDIKSKHLNERVQIEQAHLTEFTQFNEFWDEKMNAFQMQAKELQQQIIQKHGEEIEQFQQELDQYLPVKPKDSAELLNMRKIQESLAKQEKYIDAHKMQQKAIQTEREEMERWVVVREQKLKNLTQQLEQRHHNEKQALAKRIQSGEEEQRKARSLELERLLQKYQNVKQELEAQQQTELISVQKTIKSQGSVFVKPQSKRNVSNNSKRTNYNNKSPMRKTVVSSHTNFKR